MDRTAEPRDQHPARRVRVREALSTHTIRLADRRTPSEELRLTARVCGSGPPTIVMSHDGLGSIGQWREVPDRVQAVTGQTVLVFERAGHGSSTPVPTGPWPADWLHREAAVLADLCEATGADRPLLVGHSDGGSISLLGAADGLACRGVLSLAAHTWVEDVCVEAIEAMRDAPARYLFGLGLHHQHPAELFEAWSGAWVSAAFRPWDVRDLIGSIDVPVHVVQGDADEYATDAQVHATVAAIGANATGTLLPGRGHLLHFEDPDTVVQLICDAASS